MWTYLNSLWAVSHKGDLSKHRVHTHRYEDLCM